MRIYSRWALGALPRTINGVAFLIRACVPFSQEAQIAGNAIINGTIQFGEDLLSGKLGHDIMMFPDRFLTKLFDSGPEASGAATFEVLLVAVPASKAKVFAPGALGAESVTGATIRYEAEFLAGARSTGAAAEVTTFYHGTSAEYASAIRTKGINLTAGESYADFGRGFYLTTSKEEALLSAGRNYSGPLDVVEFSVPTQQLSNLSKLEFGSATGAWQDFVGFHKAYSPEILVHAGQPYDLVTGPLFRRYSGGVAIPWETRLPQTSIHTP